MTLVQSPGFANRACGQSGINTDIWAEPSSFFCSIPPERAGLSGEYDHSGLAKRVDRALHESFPSHDLAKLSVTQRGRVVVFAGYVPDSDRLRQFVETAASVNGATGVETRGVKLVERS